MTESTSEKKVVSKEALKEWIEENKESVSKILQKKELSTDEQKEEMKKLLTETYGEDIDVEKAAETVVIIIMEIQALRAKQAEQSNPSQPAAGGIGAPRLSFTRKPKTVSDLVAKTLQSHEKHFLSIDENMDTLKSLVGGYGKPGNDSLKQRAADCESINKARRKIAKNIVKSRTTAINSKYQTREQVEGLEKAYSERQTEMTNIAKEMAKTAELKEQAKALQKLAESIAKMISRLINMLFGKIGGTRASIPTQHSNGHTQPIAA